MRTKTDVGRLRAVAAKRGLALRVVDSPAREVVDFIIPIESALVIGRVGPPKEGTEEPGIAIADPRLSGRHVAFYPVADGTERLRFLDLESKNGTYHNGKRCQTGVITDGDVLRAGQTLFVTTRVPLSLFQEDPGEDLIGQSQLILAAWELAKIGGERGVSVLVLGETGSGKEGVARLVHRASKRRGPFVAVNCATLTGETATATLFGHERGAFTGAADKRRGVFGEASGGTLFLDEIGDLPLEVQPRLLRALEQHEITPLGAARPRKVDVQIVAATNSDLSARVAEGTFRGDLHARLSAWVVDLPPLRSRREDILRLARAFAGSLPDEALFEPEAAEALLLYGFPYNIRELRQITTRLAMASVRPYPFEAVQPLVTSQVSAPPAPEPSFEDTQPGTTTRIKRGQRPSKDDLLEVLERCQWNIAAVARELGRDRKQIYRWADHHGIELREST